LSGVEAALALTALLAGATGTWSPCGFSMVETLGGRGHGRGTAVAACATFAVGALAGGIVTFGGLALLGELLQGIGTAAGFGVAAVLAAAAALGELAGVRVLPQIRRQVPESWRRVMPMPVAAGLYGILLGLGFTTFVLTLAVWALAGISVALGDVELGLLVGVAFAIGRALPVVVVAPFVGSRFADAALEAMAERPLILRGLRLADGAALAACALVLGTSVAEAAATRIAESATDPSVAGGDVAWQVPGGGPGMLLRGGQAQPLPGQNPALGGGLAAWRNGETVTVARRSDLAPVLTRPVPGVDKLAVSDRWVVFRRLRPDDGHDIAAFPVADPGAEVRLWRSAAGVELGRPSIAGNRAVFHRAGPDRSAILSANLETGRVGTILRARSVQLLHPSISRGRLAYVLVSRCRQELRLARTNGRRARRLARYGPLAARDRGHEHGHTRQGSRAGRCRAGSGTRESPYMLWSTALSGRHAFFTRVRRANGVPAIVRVPRRQ
jgi:hypothetical protein